MDKETIAHIRAFALLIESVLQRVLETPDALARPDAQTSQQTSEQVSSGHVSAIPDARRADLDEVRRAFDELPVEAQRTISVVYRTCMQVLKKQQKCANTSELSARAWLLAEVCRLIQKSPELRADLDRYHTSVRRSHGDIAPQAAVAPVADDDSDDHPERSEEVARRRRLRRYGVSGTLFALVTAAFLTLAQLNPTLLQVTEPVAPSSPAESTSARSHRHTPADNRPADTTADTTDDTPTSRRDEPIGQSFTRAVQLGDLLVIFYRAVELTDRKKLYFAIINFGDRAAGGDLAADDGAGRWIRLMPASESVSAKSAVRGVVEVKDDFDVHSGYLHLRRRGTRDFED